MYRLTARPPTPPTPLHTPPQHPTPPTHLASDRLHRIRKRRRRRSERSDDGPQVTQLARTLGNRIAVITALQRTTIRLQVLSGLGQAVERFPNACDDISQVLNAYLNAGISCEGYHIGNQRYEQKDEEKHVGHATSEGDSFGLLFHIHGICRMRQARAAAAIRQAFAATETTST